MRSPVPPRRASRDRLWDGTLRDLRPPTVRAPNSASLPRTTVAERTLAYGWQYLVRVTGVSRTGREEQGNQPLSANNRIRNHPNYPTGCGYLRNAAVDQYVVACERLPDMHVSLTVRRRDLSALSEDEGTA